MPNAIAPATAIPIPREVGSAAIFFANCYYQTFDLLVSKISFELDISIAGAPMERLEASWPLFRIFLVAPEKRYNNH
jgi:hypothetical protein